MIDDTLLKSNFIGRDGFRWWVGQIPAFELGSGQEDQNNGGGWGNRSKVRIIGYHPVDRELLPDEDLPWAQVLLPPTAGSGAGNYAQNTKLRPSDYVFGFFLDGDNSQIPVIVGVFGRSSEVSTQPFTEVVPPFTPFTGFTGRIQPANGTLAPDESNEQNTQSQKSPRDVSPEIIEELNEQVTEINAKSEASIGSENYVPLDKEVTYYTAIGTKVPLGSTCSDGGIGSIIAIVSNLFNAIAGPLGAFTNPSLLINRAVSAIQAYSNGIVSQMVRSLAENLIPRLQNGLATLYNNTVAQFADEAEGILAAVAAQKGFLEPVFEIQNSFICVTAKIVSELSSIIKDLLDSVLDNAENFVTCVGTQFVGSLVNSIAFKIQDKMGPVINKVSELLEDGYDIYSVITDGIDTISKIASFLDCNQDSEKCDGFFLEYLIGKGVGSTPEPDDLSKTVLENAKISIETGQVGNTVFLGDLDDLTTSPQNNASAIPICDTSIPEFCLQPEVRIFGGGGSGGKAKAVLGGFVRNVPKEGQSIEEAPITSSIVGVKLENGGKNYKFPPFVEFVDNCRKGYGAIARTIIDSNPESSTYGQITDIYMVSIGENYPIGTTQIDTRRIPISSPGGTRIGEDLIYNRTAPRYNRPTTATVGVGSSINVGIASLTIVYPGINYVPDDTIVDPYGDEVVTGFGETINVRVDDRGRIVGFKANSAIAIVAENLPELRVKSSTGFGAIIKPSVGIVTSITKYTKIVDCIK